jgi:hypothetical protein
VLRQDERPPFEHENPMLSRSIAKAHVLRDDGTKGAPANHDEVEVSGLNLRAAIGPGNGAVRAAERLIKSIADERPRTSREKSLFWDVELVGIEHLSLAR